jgi:hypothetical protein
MLLRTHLTLFTTLSLVGLCANATAQQTQIDPTSTFLRTDPGDTQASAPLLLDLAQLGYQPGQTITIRTVGDFIWHPGQQLSGDAAVAVFSSSTTVLPAANAHRVPGAIQSTAPAYVTGPTYQTSLATDIPQDFFVGPAGVSVQIPNNGMGSAPYLLIGADDEFWGDNLDADHDFAIVIERPLGQELLTNGGFETGDTSGWQAGPGTGVTDYGQALTPAVSVSTLIQGGNKLATGGGVMVQAFDVSGNSAEIDNGTMYVQLGGYFGGYLQHGNWTALQAIFENGNGGSTGGTVDVGRIDWVNRNSQTTLMRREGVFRLPVGTRLLRIQLWLNYAGGGNVVLADNLSAKLVGNWAPTAQSVGAELLDNRGFESGIINPASPHSWIVTSGSAGVLAYGGANTPATTVQAAVNGGSNFVYGGGALEQAFDVSGNSAEIDNGTMYVHLGGYFGGYLQHGNWTALQAIFENGNGGSTGSTVDVGRIDWVNRNSQTTLMRREGVFRLPVGTRLLRIQLWLNYAGGGNLVFADNLSAKLVSNWAPTPVPLGSELLDNGNFETGNVINPAIERSWTGAGGNPMAILNYGAPNQPLPGVANTIGGGSFLGRSSGGVCEVVQWLDLRGNATDIDAQNLALHLEGHFGGVTNNGGTAHFRVETYSAFGGIIGTYTVGGVTPAERNNVTTLLFKEGDILLDYGTRRVAIILHYTDGNGLADNLKAQLLDVTTPLVYPGTGDGLVLLTGVNAVPSGGPREDIKQAYAGNILTLHTASPSNVFDGAPLFFAGNAFSTSGSVPFFGLPGLHVNPVFGGFFWLMNPTVPIGPFGSPIVVPGGTTMNFVVPNGLGGYSMLFQAMTLSSVAANSLYATSDAHEIQFQ